LAGPSHGDRGAATALGDLTQTRAVRESISAKSSAVSSQPIASTFCSTCCGVMAPAMTLATGGLAISFAPGRRRGRARAKGKGVHMGRRPKLTQEQRREARARLEEGEPVADIARSYNVNRMTIARLRP
jgi:acyl-coenzyme A thioesterase PaaI-like protein